MYKVCILTFPIFYISEIYIEHFTLSENWILNRFISFSARKWNLLAMPLGLSIILTIIILYFPSRSAIYQHCPYVYLSFYLLSFYLVFISALLLAIVGSIYRPDNCAFIIFPQEAQPFGAAIGSFSSDNCHVILSSLRKCNLWALPLSLSSLTIVFLFSLKNCDLWCCVGLYHHPDNSLWCVSSKRLPLAVPSLHCHWV